MSDAGDDMTLEDLLADFLDERDENPALTPEEFAARYPDRSAKIQSAIESTLQALHAMTDSAPAEHKRIGTFRVLREVGRGGMGIVYEAERSGRRYAVKLLPFAPISGPRAMERFRREIQILSRLDHRNIVSILESGMEDGSPYIVMEFVDGDTLNNAVAAESPRRAAELTMSIAVAVQSAHDRGVIHRDIKPQNVMMRRDGSPVLLDFGLVSSEDFASLTSTGDMVGTPRYMAPERIRGEPADPRTDVYGLGMILYELLVGQPAYDQQSRETIIQAVTRGRFPRPRRLLPDLDRRLERIAMKALAHDAKHRYATAAELADDLERFLENRRVLGRPPGPLRRGWGGVLRYPIRVAAAVVVVAVLAVALRTILEAPPPPPSEQVLADARTAAYHGVEHWLDRRSEDAERELEAALDADAGNRIAGALLAHVRATPSNGETDDAVLTALRTGLDAYEDDRLDEADGHFRDVLDAEPANPLALAMRGRIAQKQRRRNDAEESYHAAAGVLGGSAFLHRELAWIHEKNERFDDALVRARRAVEIRPADATAWTLIAKIHARRGSLEDGLAAVEEAKAALGGREDLHLMNVEASMLDELGRRPEAQRAFRKILERKPSDAQIWFNLGLSYDGEHKTKEAVDAYLKALEHDGHDRDPKPLTNLAHCYSGASKGGCGECDTFYEENPDYLDLEKAFGFWKRGVISDSRRDSAVYPALLSISFRFDRAEVLAFLEEVAQGEPDSHLVRRVRRMIRHINVRK